MVIAALERNAQKVLSTCFRVQDPPDLRLLVLLYCLHDRQQILHRDANLFSATMSDSALGIFETSAQNGCPLLGSTKIFVLILLPLDFFAAIQHEYAVPFQELNRHLLEQTAVLLPGCFFKDSVE